MTLVKVLLAILFDSPFLNNHCNVNFEQVVSNMQQHKRTEVRKKSMRVKNVNKYLFESQYESLLLFLNKL